MSRLTVLGRGFVASALLIAVAANFASAQEMKKEQMVEHKVFTNKQNVAINGYDPVSYFTQTGPAKGTSEYRLKWLGAEWRFASAKNMAAFQAKPVKYAPEYGGYCAWGIAAKGELFPVDPTAWKIVDGRLFLNFNPEIQKSWLADTAGFIKTGDAKWANLHKAAMMAK